jgi:hypothetical protein
MSMNGTQTVGTRVPPEVRDWIDEQADRLGTSRTAVLRGLVRFYEAARDGEVACDSCGESARFDPPTGTVEELWD